MRFVQIDDDKWVADEKVTTIVASNTAHSKTEVRLDDGHVVYSKWEPSRVADILGADPT